MPWPWTHSCEMKPVDVQTETLQTTPAGEALGLVARRTFVLTRCRCGAIGSYWLGGHWTKEQVLGQPEAPANEVVDRFLGTKP